MEFATVLKTLLKASIGYDQPMNNAPQHQFILEVVDRERLCPVLQSIFQVTDLNALHAILGNEAAGDPELLATYSLGADELSAINEQFHVGFQPELLGLPNINISLFKRRQGGMSPLPYLAHTGYELPLMLDGRKKLTKMSDGYPPWNFPGEEIFDRWVLEGRLHKEIAIEPFDGSNRQFEGLRTVYYTPKGEEWRIPATKMIWRAAKAAGGWNEHFERLEGMLGDRQAENVGLGARSLHPITAVTLHFLSPFAWIETAVQYRGTATHD
jgi:hypothetical protein